MTLPDKNESNHGEPEHSGAPLRRVSGRLGGLAIAGLLAAAVLVVSTGTPVAVVGTAGTPAPSSQPPGPAQTRSPLTALTTEQPKETAQNTTSPTRPAASASSAPASLSPSLPVAASPLATASVALRTAAPVVATTAPVVATSAPLVATTAPVVVPPALFIAPVGGTQVYLHYYLWWTARHWQDKLGAAYPYQANPLPLPGQTDASGCSPTVLYPGATIVDIPSGGLYDQSLAATFDAHIATAVAYGITGFVADWAGNGATGQSPSSSGYNARLDLLVQRVNAWNASHIQKFRLAIAFAAFDNYTRAASALINDLAYFAARYGSNAAFANAFAPRPLVMIMTSRKFALATIQAVSAAARPALFLLGDETSSSLSRDAAYLDGSSYYWSSESPSNSGARSQIASLGSQLRAAGKPWFAPFTAGYDAVLIGGHCVPRSGVSTLDTIWSWNRASNPDAWFGISWNEYVENTYLEPSLKYGATYLAEIKRLSGR